MATRLPDGIATTRRKDTCGGQPRRYATHQPDGPDAEGLIDELSDFLELVTGPQRTPPASMPPNVEGPPGGIRRSPTTRADPWAVAAYAPSETTSPRSSASTPAGTARASAERSSPPSRTRARAFGYGPPRRGDRPAQQGGGALLPCARLRRARELRPISRAARVGLLREGAVDTATRPNVPSSRHDQATRTTSHASAARRSTRKKT